MSIIIGIDAGISSTKILGIENGKRIMAPMSISCNDAVSSIFGVLDKYLHENDEFKANGLGARFDSGLDHIIVVSMGTGTSMVRVDGDEISHIGGIGMGGGTLKGLSQLLLHTSDIGEVNQLSEGGDIDNINLRMKDICKEDFGSFFAEVTASLFAKAGQSKPSANDIAAGIVHMVLETIGSAAVMSQLNGGFKDFVLIGKLTELTSCKYVFPMMERLYNVHFHIPKYAPYCTALGAALSYGYKNE